MMLTKKEKQMLKDVEKVKFDPNADVVDNMLKFLSCQALGFQAFELSELRRKFAKRHGEWQKPTKSTKESI